jgi:hypothetical protein
MYNEKPRHNYKANQGFRCTSQPAGGLWVAGVLAGTKKLSPGGESLSV